MKTEFGKRKVEKSGFGRREAECWGVISLGWGKRGVGETAFAWSSFETLAQFGETEFEKRKVEKSKSGKWELICLESRTQEVEMVGLAWLSLATPALFAKAPVSRAFEFAMLEFGRPGVERWEPICLELGIQ